jgi:CheY-like chemotaxis protein
VLRPSVLNLNSVVSDTDKMLRSLIREDVDLKLTLHPELREVKADPGQMMQVIMNLAVNARDAMPEGGTLAIETDNVEFERDTLCQGVAVRAGRYVLLAVSDTGIGMDPETQTRMFEPFFTTKPTGQGTGLGLATVYGIVTQSAGYIFADSEIGKGTTFTIYLPQVDKGYEVAQLPKPPAPALRGTETILLVEDAMALREIIRESLQAVGYQVLLAANGAEALEVVRQHSGPIHLLITDVVMPQMSGPELAQRVAAICPETPVLYMSGYADTLARFRALHPDVVFIQKPFALAALSQKVREVLTPR